MLYNTWRRRRFLPRCTLCGREISLWAEYWACNGQTVCRGCLAEFAREEFAPCREVCGKEAVR